VALFEKLGEGDLQQPAHAGCVMRSTELIEKCNENAPTG